MKKKTPRTSGFKSRTIYRDSYRRFTSRDNAVSEETWSYRESKVKGKKKIQDLKIDALSYGEGDVFYYPSIQIPETGKRAGRLSAILKKSLRQIGVSRHDTRIDISMSAKTYHGKIVKRKLSFYHYNSKRLEEHTVAGIINQLFYEYGDRPAYPVNIVKGWRGRQVTKKETMKRRQLHDVTFNITTDHSVTRKQAKKKKIKK